MKFFDFETSRAHCETRAGSAGEDLLYDRRLPALDGDRYKENSLKGLPVGTFAVLGV